jgi:5-methylcytosine-specific restriction endonuclease McrA
MKTCKDCKKELPIRSFHKKPSNKDGRDIRCKGCKKIRYNEPNARKVFAKIYCSQIDHSISRDQPSPTYTFDDLVAWAEQQSTTVDLWEGYVASGYETRLRPSVDRVDDSKGYELTNIQLTTWGESSDNGTQGKKAGTLNSNQRAVAAHNKDGSPHKEYVSIMDAARDVDGRPSGIAGVANGVPVKDGRGYLNTPKSYKGFIWKWMTQNI